MKGQCENLISSCFQDKYSQTKVKTLFIKLNRHSINENIFKRYFKIKNVFIKKTQENAVTENENERQSH